MFNTFGPLSSGAVNDLGLGQLTEDELQRRQEEMRKKKRLAVANANPGAYGDAGQGLASRMLFGVQV